MINLENKTILVTGASRGIGAATAATLVQAGAHVILHYSASKEPAFALARELGVDKTVCVHGDLSIAWAGQALWREAIDWRGQIDVVINNAGVYLPHSIDDPDTEWQEAWQTTLQVNLVAAGDLARCAIKHWRDTGGGILINVASRAAHRGEAADYCAYAASKGGMIAMSKTIARNWADKGVLAYCVAPGFVASKMAQEAFDDEPNLEKAVVADIPLGEIAPAQEVANCVAFLASGLARHATGTTIDVNGASYVR